MIVIIILLIFTSFFLSGSETALTAVNRTKVQSLADQGDKKSHRLLKLTEKPDELITAILIGNNVSNIMLPTLVTITALQYGFSVGAATAILTVVLIIFAEVLPKSIAATFADKMSYVVAPIIQVVLILFKPLTFLLNRFTRGIIQLMTKDDIEVKSYSREEIKTMVNTASHEGTLENAESHRINRVIDFYKKDIRDALKIPRIEIVGIPIESNYEDTLDIVVNHSYTRYPVYKDNMDHIVGVFHSKFILEWSENKEREFTEFIDNEPLFVTETNSIDNVFKMMLKHKKHLAIVLDEYGGTMGIISQEDIIEAMIGEEIEDELDQRPERLIEELTDTRIVCDGKLPISQFNEIFKAKVDEEEDIISGFLYKEFGYIPTEGETLNYGNLQFEILEMDHNKIETVEIIKKTEE